MNAIAPSLFAKLPYDAEKDFAPVTLTASVPHFIVVHPSLPVKSVKELIAYAKARPGALTFPSAGNGSTPHLAGEMFKSMAGVVLASSVGFIEKAKGRERFPRSDDTVAEGEPLFAIRVLTNALELTAPAAGTLGPISIEEGAFVEFGEPLASITPDRKRVNDEP